MPDLKKLANQNHQLFQMNFQDITGEVATMNEGTAFLEFKALETAAKVRQHVIMLI